MLKSLFPYAVSNALTPKKFRQPSIVKSTAMQTEDSSAMKLNITTRPDGQTDVMPP